MAGRVINCRTRRDTRPRRGDLAARSAARYESIARARVSARNSDFYETQIFSTPPPPRVIYPGRIRGEFDGSLLSWPPGNIIRRYIRRRSSSFHAAIIIELLITRLSARIGLC